MARGMAAAMVGLAVSLGACAPDTYFPPNDMDRLGTWQAEGINDRNLRVMAADPAHLTTGVGATTDRGQQASAAVSALEGGRRPPLPQGLSDIGAQAGGGAAGVSSGGGGGR